MLFVVAVLGFQSLGASDRYVAQPDPETFIQDIVLFFNGSTAEAPRISAEAQNSLKSGWLVTQEIPRNFVPRQLLRADSEGTVRARILVRYWVEIARYINRNKGLAISRKVATWKDVCVWAVSDCGGNIYFCYIEAGTVIFIGKTPGWSDKADSLSMCGCLANTIYGNNLKSFCAAIAECDRSYPLFIDGILGGVGAVASRTPMLLPTAASSASWHTDASVSKYISKTSEEGTFAAVVSPKRSCDEGTGGGVVFRVTGLMPLSVSSEGSTKEDLLVSMSSPRRKRGGKGRRPAVVLGLDATTPKVETVLEDILRGTDTIITITPSDQVLSAAGQLISLTDVNNALAQSVLACGEEALDAPHCALYYRPRDKALLVLNGKPRDTTLVRLLGNSASPVRKTMSRLYKYLAGCE
ncbi:MAG: hypothetical protein QG604_226 [Candidatus Dependentiae bacterium]|nr:hypothetical protein [Candidatus Dependentiae bacterium]